MKKTLKVPKFRYSPFKEGLDQILGKLEKQIMETLWLRGESSVRDILEGLNHSQSYTYSTLITVMNRLSNKGILEKKKVGKTFFYKPTYTKAELLDIVSKKVIQGISELSLQATILNFIDYISSKDSKQLDHLSELIKNRKKQNL
ncbi:MAG: BlaI/MecI/CopY family transcriptional regulator [Candidatus Scalinduaceae bacterium]